MQVDPIKSKLKPPGTGRLKLKYDVLLSTYAFKFKLRRYILGGLFENIHSIRIQDTSMVGPATYDTSYSSTRILNRLTSVCRLGEMPVQSWGQSDSASRGKAGARLNAHTVLRMTRQRTSQEAIYRNQPLVNGILRRGEQYLTGPGQW